LIAAHVSLARISLPEIMTVGSVFTQKWALPAFVQRLSGRERLLIGSLAMVGLVLLPLKAYDWQQTAAANFAGDQADLLSARQIARGEATTKLLSDLRARRREVLSWSWAAPTPTIGRVLAENEISTLALKAGMTTVETVSINGAQYFGGVELVKVELNATFDWKSMSEFFSELSALNKGFVLESIAVSEGTPKKLRIVLRLPLASAIGSHP
jgi:hypothetical protein